MPGFKLGEYHHREEQVNLDNFQQEPDRADQALLRDLTEKHFSQAAGPTMWLATCLFINSPDEHFLLDTLPDHPQVTVGAGFSGHGFKFASVIGEILADLAVNGKSDYEIDVFSLDRFD